MSSFEKVKKTLENLRHLAIGGLFRVAQVSSKNYMLVLQLIRQALELYVNPGSSVQSLSSDFLKFVNNNLPMYMKFVNFMLLRLTQVETRSYRLDQMHELEVDVKRAKGPLFFASVESEGFLLFRKQGSTCLVLVNQFGHNNLYPLLPGNLGTFLVPPSPFAGSPNHVNWHVMLHVLFALQPGLLDNLSVIQKYPAFNLSLFGLFMMLSLSDRVNFKDKENLKRLVRIRGTLEKLKVLPTFTKPILTGGEVLNLDIVSYNSNDNLQDTLERLFCALTKPGQEFVFPDVICLQEINNSYIQFLLDLNSKPTGITFVSAKLKLRFLLTENPDSPCTFFLSFAKYTPDSSSDSSSPASSESKGKKRKSVVGTRTRAPSTRGFKGPLTSTGEVIVPEIKYSSIFPKYQCVMAEQSAGYKNVPSTYKNMCILVNITNSKNIQYNNGEEKYWTIGRIYSEKKQKILADGFFLVDPKTVSSLYENAPPGLNSQEYNIEPVGPSSLSDEEIEIGDVIIGEPTCSLTSAAASAGSYGAAASAGSGSVSTISFDDAAAGAGSGSSDDAAAAGAGSYDAAEASAGSGSSYEGACDPSVGYSADNVVSDTDLAQITKFDFLYRFVNLFFSGQSVEDVHSATNVNRDIVERFFDNFNEYLKNVSEASQTPENNFRIRSESLFRARELITNRLNIESEELSFKRNLFIRGILAVRLSYSGQSFYIATIHNLNKPQPNERVFEAYTRHLMSTEIPFILIGDTNISVTTKSTSDYLNRLTKNTNTTLCRSSALTHASTLIDWSVSSENFTCNSMKTIPIINNVANENCMPTRKIQIYRTPVLNNKEFVGYNSASEDDIDVLFKTPTLATSSIYSIRDHSIIRGSYTFNTINAAAAAAASDSSEVTDMSGVEEKSGDAPDDTDSTEEVAAMDGVVEEKKIKQERTTTTIDKISGRFNEFCNDYCKTLSLLLKEKEEAKQKIIDLLSIPEQQCIDTLQKLKTQILSETNAATKKELEKTFQEKETSFSTKLSLSSNTCHVYLNRLYNFKEAQEAGKDILVEIKKCNASLQLLKNEGKNDSDDARKLVQNLFQTVQKANKKVEKSSQTDLEIFNVNCNDFCVNAAKRNEEDKEISDTFDNKLSKLISSFKSSPSPKKRRKLSEVKSVSMDTESPYQAYVDKLFAKVDTTKSFTEEGILLHEIYSNLNFIYHDILQERQPRIRKK